PPVLALLTGRWLLRAWSADRLATRPALISLGGGVAAVAIAIASGIGYRAIEVPEDASSEEDVSYVSGLAPLEVNDSGRQFRTAAERYDRVAQSIVLSPDHPAYNRRASLGDRLLNTPYGTAEPDPDVVEWVTKVYESDQSSGEQDESWHVQASQASRDKTGIFEHPLRTGT